MNIITQRLMIRPFEFGDWQDLQRIALDNLPSVKLLKRLGFEQVSEEEICFYEGHPFRGGSFVRPVNNPTKNLLDVHSCGCYNDRKINKKME